jgi:hypothetical protein
MPPSRACGSLRLVAAMRVLGLALGACGDDDGSLAGDADGGMVADPAQQFDEPGDFPRLDCAPGSFAGFDPVAPSPVWHQDIAITSVGDFAGVHKYTQETLGLSALMNGRPATTVTLDGDDFFVRVQYQSDDGKARVRTYDACAVRADGSLFGYFASCNQEDEICYQGTFSSVRVMRRPGEADAQGVALVSEFEGEPSWSDEPTINVRVKDGVAYLVRFADGLRLVDVSDPAAPHDLGHLVPAYADQGEIWNDVKIVDGLDGRRWALVASNALGIVPVDVTDPATPLAGTAFPPPPPNDNAAVHTLFTESFEGRTRAYLADTRLIGLQVWDVTDPAAPEKLGQYVHPDVATDYSAYLHDLYVEDGVAYLNYWSLGLVVVDATTPSAITLVGQYRDYERRKSHSNWVTTTTSGRRVSVHGDEDFTAHMRVIDVDTASPTFMTAIGELSLRPEVSIHNIMAEGDRAYVAWYQDGFRLVDLTDPTAPAVIAYYNSWDGRDGRSFYEGAIGLDLDLGAGLVYLADTARGLMILRLVP